MTNELKAQPDPWKASGADWCSSIHSNPDAKAWADFFVAVFPGQADKHELMIGWFANAMMAMHDHLKAQPSGVVLPERMTWDGLRATACNIRGEGWNACLDEVSRLNPAPSHGEQVRDGWKLVPERMHLSREAIESITAHCGDGQEDAGYGPYSDGVLWVGEIEEEDGAKTYGLHIATTDYPEEGSTTLVEFAAPSAASQKGGE